MLCFLFYVLLFNLISIWLLAIKLLLILRLHLLLRLLNSLLLCLLVTVIGLLLLLLVGLSGLLALEIEAPLVALLTEAVRVVLAISVLAPHFGFHSLSFPDNFAAVVYLGQGVLARLARAIFLIGILDGSASSF